jgi:hypothetical protein
MISKQSKNRSFSQSNKIKQLTDQNYSAVERRLPQVLSKLSISKLLQSPDRRIKSLASEHGRKPRMRVQVQRHVQEEEYGCESSHLRELLEAKLHRKRSIEDELDVMQRMLNRCQKATQESRRHRSYLALLQRFKLR